MTSLGNQPLSCPVRLSEKPHSILLNSTHRRLQSVHVTSMPTPPGRGPTSCPFLGSIFLPHPLVPTSPESAHLSKVATCNLWGLAWGPCNLSWKTNPRSFVSEMSRSRSSKGDRRWAAEGVPNTTSFGGRNCDKKNRAVLGTHSLPWAKTSPNPPITIKTLVFGKFLLSLRCRRGGNCRKEGVIK